MLTKEKEMSIAMDPLYTCFAIVMILFFVVVILFVAKRTGELVNPLFIFAVLSIVDIYIPSIIFLNLGINGLPPWIQIDNYHIGLTLLLFSGAAFLFCFGYFITLFFSRKKSRQQSIDYWKSNDVNLKMLLCALIFSGSWYLLSLWNNVTQTGSLSQYLGSKFYLRWEGSTQEYSSAFWAILMKIAPTMMNVSLICIGILFYLRKRYNRQLLWGLVLPVIGWLFTITTFFRGTQLLYFLGLFTVEVFRLKDENISLQAILLNVIKGQRKKKYIYIILVLAVIFFAGYGAVRSFFSAKEWGSSIGFGTAIMKEVTKNFQGSALTGLSSIVQSYPKNLDYLDGKTIKDMLLLPVPRSIWPSKPEWYGIDDITRGMGWPPSTQSAVSMPGEFYANFGPMGILLMFFYGIVFGLIFSYRNSSKLKFIYPFKLLSLMFVTFWMSFTGFMNSIIQLPILIAFMYLIIRKRSSNKNNSGA